MVEVVYRDLSPNIRAMVEPSIDKWLHVIPDWCRTLIIREGAGVEGAVAEMNVSPEYRRATLFVHPLLMAQHDICRVILHEFMHMYTTPACMVARQYLEDAKIEGGEAETLRRRIVDMEEGSTEDLVSLIMSFHPPLMATS